MANFEGVMVKSAVYKPNVTDIGYTTHIMIRRREIDKSRVLAPP